MQDTSRFELVAELPDMKLRQRTERLIGFSSRYMKIEKDLEMLLAPEKVRDWSKKLHGRILPVCEILEDRYPLIIFHGDVGTGKTATAEGVADRLTTRLDRDGTLFKLSTRVRGKGLHGEMSKLLGEAFDDVMTKAGRARMAFLVIDEADALAASREGSQLHQEEKAGTNTLIQKIDQIRGLRGRILVILCTNRLNALDPAVIRRAARIEEFCRPSDEERIELLMADLAELGLSKQEMTKLAKLCGPHPKEGRLGMTFSDLRTRFLPAAVAEAFPDKPLTFELLEHAARTMTPSPSMNV
ncbi:MAG: ATP-binding protein [Polyangia bacterium]